MSLTVVKIGGNVIDDSEELDRFLADFVQLPSPKILIHGGGKLATRLSGKLGVETKKVDGRRITDHDILDIVTMVYAGLVNKNIVAKLQAAGCNAVGLSGADGNTMPATRRSPKPVDFGFVGDINPSEMNAPFIKMLLDAGITPVFCALTHDGKGSMLNSNADSVASAVAVAVSSLVETHLVFCFEKLGVMKDVDNPDTLIPEINLPLYEKLRADGIVNSGMIPKVDNAFAAIRQGVKSVTIKHSKNLNVPQGTVIKL